MYGPWQHWELRNELTSFQQFMHCFCVVLKRCETMCTASKQLDKPGVNIRISLYLVFQWSFVVQLVYSLFPVFIQQQTKNHLKITNFTKWLHLVSGTMELELYLQMFKISASCWCWKLSWHSSIWNTISFQSSLFFSVSFSLLFYNLTVSLKLGW